MQKFGNLQNSSDIKAINDLRYKNENKSKFNPLSAIDMEEEKKLLSNGLSNENEDIDDPYAKRKRELEREGKLLMETYSMNINQIEDTEKVIFELSTLL